MKLTFWQINTPFGSRVIDEKYGIILNNHMDDFSAFGHNYYKIPPYAKNRIGTCCFVCL